MTDILTQQEREELRQCLEKGQDQSQKPRPKPAGKSALGNCVDRRAFMRGGAALIGTARNNMNFTASGLGSYTRALSGRTFTGNQVQNEWAGACFSPDGEWLFVNIQTPGVTFAITGPWKWRGFRRDDWAHDNVQWNWENRGNRE